MRNLSAIRESSEIPPVNAEKPKADDSKIQETQENIAKDIKNLAFNPKPMPHEKYDAILTADAQLPTIIVSLYHAKNKDEALKKYNRQIIFYLEEIITVKEYLRSAFVEQVENCLQLAQNQGLNYAKLKEFIKYFLNEETEFQRKKIIGKELKESKRLKELKKTEKLKTTPTAPVEKTQKVEKSNTAPAKEPQKFERLTAEDIQARNRRMIEEYRREHGIR